MLPAKDRLNICFAHGAYRMAERFALRGTGIDPDELDVPGARISYRQHIGLHRNLARLSLPADFGFADEAFSIASYGMLGYAMMSAATFGKAIQIAMKYYRTAGPLCSVALEAGPKVSAIVAEDSFELGDDVLRLVIEEMFSTFPPLLNLLLGDLRHARGWPVAEMRDFVAHDVDGRERQRRERERDLDGRRVPAGE